MDEPFASVDAQTRVDLEDLILDVYRSIKRKRESAEPELEATRGDAPAATSS
jgi:hypothetical protein